jgi:hypothetical protein
LKEWFTPANILQMIYILVTLVFSTLIWKATQAGAKAAKAATEASNASLEMARDLKKRQEEEEEQLQAQYRYDVFAKSLIILDSAKKLKKEITTEELKKLPMKFDVGTKEAAKYFNGKEQGLIQRGKVNIELIRRDLFQDGVPHFTVNQENEEKFNNLYRIFKELSDELEKAPL